MICLRLYCKLGIWELNFVFSVFNFSVYEFFFFNDLISFRFFIFIWEFQIVVVLCYVLCGEIYEVFGIF